MGVCRLRLVFRIVILNVVLLGAQGTVAQAADKQASSNGHASPFLPPNLSSFDRNPQFEEDYSTPALTTSTVFASIEPLRIEFDEGPGFTREIVRVNWRPGDPIDLYVIKPVGVKKPPVILYLYDYPTENDAYHRSAFCQLLTKDGFAAVGFVSALTGERYHGRPMKEWFVSELRESLATTAHDVQMVLNYMATRNDLDMNRVGMFGDGSGASIAILAAGVDPRIKAVDLLDPWGDWPDWIAKSTRVPENERPGFLKPEWLKRVEPLDPVQWLPKLRDQKVRLQFVKSVTITPADVQAKIEAVAPPNVRIAHYDDAAAFQASISDGTGFDWIKHHVEGNSAAQYRAARTPTKTPAAGNKNSQQ